MALMNNSQYARHRGVSEKRIRQYIAQGHISFEAFEKCPKTGKLLLNVELADKDLKHNMDHGRAMSSKALTKNKVASTEVIGETKSSGPAGVKIDKIESSSVTPPVVNTPPPPSEFDLDIERYQKSKADTEFQRAKKLKLETAEREGTLLNAENVRKMISKLVGETKEKLLNIPSKIAPELVSMEDVLEIENKISNEINEVLENLSRLGP